MTKGFSFHLRFGSVLKELFVYLENPLRVLET